MGGYGESYIHPITLSLITDLKITFILTLKKLSRKMVDISKIETN
jgi:hypothetical protein